jgi:hypothetical protein
MYFHIISQLVCHIKEECFGGSFTQSSDFKMLPEERVRYQLRYLTILFEEFAPHHSMLVRVLLLKSTG